jgi:hypothetical protein
VPNQAIHTSHPSQFKATDDGIQTNITCHPSQLRPKQIAIQANITGHLSPVNPKPVAIQANMTSQARQTKSKPIAIQAIQANRTSPPSQSKHTMQCQPIQASTSSQWKEMGGHPMQNSSHPSQGQKPFHTSKPS